MKLPLLVIGLVGKKRSGKDTAYSIIEHQAFLSGIRAARFAFADPLKSELASAFGTTPEAINSNKEQYRYLLQAWGEARRNLVGKDYWINKAIESVMANPPEVAVFTDCRYLNEADLISKMGGLVIKIVRPTVGPVDNHSSEVEQDEIEADFNIFNTATIESLSNDIKGLWDSHLFPNVKARIYDPAQEG